VLFEKKLSWIRPGEMISAEVPGNFFASATGAGPDGGEAQFLEISLEPEDGTP